VGDPVSPGEVIGYIDPSRAGAFFEKNPILATVPGAIISLPVSPGETVTTATQIAAIGSLARLKITIYVAEKYSAYLKKGLPASVSFAAAPGERFAAAVSTISPVVNSGNRTIETELLLDKLDARIKPGMYADVDLVIRQREDTIVIPKTALKNYNDQQVVYVIDQNQVARRRPVVTGLSNDLEIEILDGVFAGDQVITAGAVTDGSPVRMAGE